MHVPLDPHLHTEECNVIIAALKECQTSTNKLQQVQQKSFGNKSRTFCAWQLLFCQLFGVCNDLDLAMRKCTRKERLERTQVNLEESRARQKAARARLSEMEAQVQPE